MPKYVIQGCTRNEYITHFDIEAGSREEAVRNAFEGDADSLEDVETINQENTDLEEWSVIKVDGKQVEDDETGARLAEAMPKPPALPILRILIATEKLIEAARNVKGSWEHGDLAAAVRRLVKAMEEAEDAMDERTIQAQKGASSA